MENNNNYIVVICVIVKYLENMVSKLEELPDYDNCKKVHTLFGKAKKIYNATNIVGGRTDLEEIIKIFYRIKNFLLQHPEKNQDYHNYFIQMCEKIEYICHHKDLENIRDVIKNAEAGKINSNN